MNALRPSLAVAVAALALSACGTWSNRDLDFVEALPTRDDLKAKLPVSATAQPLEGVSTRADGLNVGDPSTAYAATKKAQTDFNGLLDFLLGVVDTVRTLPPTTRTADSRTWGPYADRKNPGWEFAVTIAQTNAADQPAQFGWAIRARKTGADFIDLLDGTFTPSDTAKRGDGAIAVHVKDFRDQLAVNADLKQLDSIAIAYDTKGFPRRVGMQFAFASTSSLSSLGYTYQEQADQSGFLVFRATRPDPVLAAPAQQVLDFGSKWLASGAGVAAVVVKSGSYAGATVAECWDTSFKVSYYAESWAGGQTSGLRTDCVDVGGF